MGVGCNGLEPCHDDIHRGQEIEVHVVERYTTASTQVLRAPIDMPDPTRSCTDEFDFRAGDTFVVHVGDTRATNNNKSCQGNWITLEELDTVDVESQIYRDERLSQVPYLFAGDATVANACTGRLHVGLSVAAGDAFRSASPDQPPPANLTRYFDVAVPGSCDVFPYNTCADRYAVELALR